MGQDPPIPPFISIDDSQLAIVENLRYLGSAISHNLSLDAEINARIGKATGVMSTLTKENLGKQKSEFKHIAQSVQLLCTQYHSIRQRDMPNLLSKKQAQRLSHEMSSPYLRHRIGRQDHKPGSPQQSQNDIFVMLSKRRLRWLGHVRLMNKEHLPKNLLYDQLEVGTRKVGRPGHRFFDACKRDLKKTYMTSTNGRPHHKTAYLGEDN